MAQEDVEHATEKAVFNLVDSTNKIKGYNPHFLLTIAQFKCFIVAPDTYKGFYNETFIIFQGILSDDS